MTVIVRAATEDDFEALTKLNLMHTVGDRYLAAKIVDADNLPRRFTVFGHGVLLLSPPEARRDRWWLPADFFCCFQTL